MASQAQRLLGVARRVDRLDGLPDSKRPASVNIMNLSIGIHVGEVSL